MNKQVQISRHSRRTFIKYGSIASAAALAGPYFLRGQNLNSRLNIAQIGCWGKGGSDAQCCSTENIVALCDVNSEATDRLKQYLPTATVYKDFRELFDKEKSIDAVDVATPDHTHCVAAATAIKLGKHVYCQKPLTHDVAEARLLRDLARQHKVATQMGNQGSASDGLRRGVELVQAGLIGPVHEVYVWTNRPIWPQGKDKPSGADPIPANLDWDLWLGTAPTRAFKGEWPAADAAGMGQVLQFSKNVYQPFNWRGWVDFGTGALGDMACHTVNWPFRALKLGYPTEIEATSSGMKADMYPVSSKIRFQFPAREGLPPVTFHWLDGGNTPPAEITAPIAEIFGGISPSGCIMIGDKGMVFAPDDGDQDLHVFVKLKDEKQISAVTRNAVAKAIPESIPRNAFDPTAAPDMRHHQEWITACKTGKHEVAYSNFEIAAYLTEIILLGCVALRAGQKLEWDGPAMKAKNVDVSKFLKRDYRAPWKV